jgi:hypothetical protein
MEFKRFSGKNMNIPIVSYQMRKMKKKREENVLKVPFHN